MDNTIYRPVVNSITDKDWEYYLSFSPWKFIQITSESLKNSNRFFVDERFTKLIFWFIFGQESRYEAQHLVRPNQCLYRARIYDNTNVLTDNKSTKDASFRGYNKIGSFVPTDASKTPAGRANPENIIYLYASSDVDTAIAEVNPNLKDKISVAEIKVLERLFVLDLAKSITWTNAETPEQTSWLQAFILGLSSFFQTPHREKYDYLLCQYVSELVKNVGLDGIRFNSSKKGGGLMDGCGVNYTIFNYKKCEPVSSDLYMVNNIVIDYCKIDSGDIE